MNSQRRNGRIAALLAVACALAACGLALLFVASRMQALRSERAAALRAVEANALEEELIVGVRERAEVEAQLAAANERAALFDKHAPFLYAAAFRGERVGLLQRRARLRAIEVTATPDPKASPYADCLIAVRAEVLELDPVLDGEEGSPPGLSQPAAGDEVLVHLWGFRDRELSHEAALREGATFSGALVAADAVSDELHRLRVADTIGAFELDVWFGCEVALEGGPRITRPHTVDPRIAKGASREDALGAVRARVLEELELYGGGSWDTWLARTAPFRDALHELRKLESGLEDPALDMQLRLWDEDHEHVEPGSDALLIGPALGVSGGAQSGPVFSAAEIVGDVSKQLAEHGIDLVYVPIQQKTCVYPEWLLPEDALEALPEDGILSPHWRRYVADLCAAGVETVDLLPFLLEAKRTSQDVPEGEGRSLFLFDHHWAPATIEIAADLVAQRLERYGFDERERYELEPGTLRLRGNAHAAYKVVSAADGAPFAQDPRSSVIVLGDSNLDVGSGRTETGVRSPVDGGVGTFNALLSERISFPVAGGGRRLIFESGGLAKAPKGFLRDCKVLVIAAAMIRPAKPGHMPSERVVLPERLFR
jgi:hypothetical protein